MTTRDFLVLALTTLSGVVIAGCRRSALVSQTPSIARTPQRVVPDLTWMTSTPLGRFNPPVQERPPALQIPGKTTNSWKPQATERQWTSIVIHHTATSRGSVESIHQSHLNRRDTNGNRWKGIGYHFVIGNGNGMSDGEVEPTFRWREQLHGAHAGVARYNQQGIGIVLVGNFEEVPPTSAQLAAVKRLVATLKEAYGISAENVVGHSDIKATACPGRYFPMVQVSRSPSPAGFSGRRLGRNNTTLAELQRNPTP